MPSKHVWLKLVFGLQLLGFLATLLVLLFYAHG